MRKLILSSLSLILTTPLVLGGEAQKPAAFARKPVATRAGDQVKIEFAVDRETDVAVYIEDAKGKIVRHLVAGVLGPKAPEPLKAGLDQAVEWDGKDDDGQAAAGEPFKVRVGLGLAPAWGGTVFADQSGPNFIEGVKALATGPDGRVYVAGHCGAWLYWKGTKVLVFRRDGSYEKTIKPFPSTLSVERVKATGAFVNSFGRLNPIVHRPLGLTFYPQEGDEALTVTPDGRIVLAVRSSDVWEGQGAGHFGLIDTEGGVPETTYAGPALKAGFAARIGMVSAADGKALYVAGLGPHSSYKPSSPWHAVYKVKLPERGPAEVFFGEPDKAGGDNTHFSEPASVALDGQGHLLVADFGNNRVLAINEAGRTYAGSFPVDAPSWVAVHPKTGAVYVCSKRTTVIKFSPATGSSRASSEPQPNSSPQASSGQAGWKDVKEQARADLSGLLAKIHQNYRAKTGLSFALDAAAEPAVLWTGCGGQLVRCEDRGGKFSDPVPAGYYNPPLLWRPAADPARREVSSRVGSWTPELRILDEETGQVRKVPLGGEGATYRLGPDGQIYGVWHGSKGVYRCDRNGKRLPFEATAADPVLKGNVPGPSTTAAWERDFWVDRRGNVWTRGSGALTSVEVYGPDGKRQRTALWGVSDGSYGPRTDARGNIYMLECLEPEGRPFPEELKPHLSGKYGAHWYDWIYGSVVKFGPAGGNIRIKPRNDKEKPGTEPVALPGSAPKEKVHVNLRGDGHEVQGALWIRDGVSHTGGVALCSGGTNHCHCTGCDFDVDDFGRVFLPDNGRFRVGVLDTNGNAILSFGGYGNQDFCGPESYVLDPAGKFLRPRKTDDPKELASPFANPEIAMGWIVGLAVTDRYAYVDDVLNKRILRVKLDYTATEVCALP